MPQYLSPGVYVEEVPSAIQPIAGVGTSTAGFIGIFKDPVPMARPNPFYDKGRKEPDLTAEVAPDAANLLGATVETDLGLDPEQVELPAGSNLSDYIRQLKAQDQPPLVTVWYMEKVDDLTAGQKLWEDLTDQKGEPISLTKTKVLKKGYEIKEPDVPKIKDKLEALEKGEIKICETADISQIKDDDSKSRYLVEPVKISMAIGAAGQDVKDASLARRIANAFIEKNKPDGTDKKIGIKIPNQPFLEYNFNPSKEIKLCTNFSEFKTYFGDFSMDSGQNRLAHAIYGFFNNGGTRCYVGRTTAVTGLDALLEKFAIIDEIAIMAAPGLRQDINEADVQTIYAKVDGHCKQTTRDRFAIFDSSAEVKDEKGFLDLDKLNPKNEKKVLPGNSDYAAYYFPWIQVFDPIQKLKDPEGSGLIDLPPSGHVAGIYARVDSDRGVHKAPANEPILGALGLKYKISQNQQKGLNPQGVNCIRDLNGNIRVWGARTLGGDANGKWKYINVRRLFLYLRKSIDQGTQWVVFEPNDRNLWAKITRNITAFLTNVWRDGALFGSTPQEAFYVKCDDETNPPEVRDDGKLVTEIGVAVVKPAEFVIFRISQWAGAGG